MKVQSSQNQALIQKLHVLVKEERRIGVEILEILLQIEQRKAYSELGYDGLFSFCVKELKYSESQAYRRIQAMRALKDVPALKDSIVRGEMTVTTVSQVQTFIRQEKLQGRPLSDIQKGALFQEFNQVPAKQVQEALLSKNGEEAKLKLQIDLNPAVQALWNRAKDLTAHQTQGNALKILELILNEWLEVNDPEIQNSRRTPSSLTKVVTKEPAQAKPVSLKPVRYLPIQTRRFVWRRDRGQCVLCNSRFAIQFDHRVPLALGGSNAQENLRLLCRNCNLAQGIQQFGMTQMKRV